jgi:hypothetical protein
MVKPLWLFIVRLSIDKVDEVLDELAKKTRKIDLIINII